MGRTKSQSRRKNIDVLDIDVSRFTTHRENNSDDEKSGSLHFRQHTCNVSGSIQEFTQGINRIEWYVIKPILIRI